jgi:23S rRNA pseudouridine1911/1915/1917 synthase
MTPDIFSLNVKAELANTRLDVFVSGAMEEMTRSTARKLITSGKALINDEKAKPSHKVKEGDVVTVIKEAAVPLEASAEDIPIDIIYEDESFVVVNKSPNMVVHPAAGNYSGTLVNALLHHLKDLSGIGGVMRPGIVHRLDKGTSGIIVAAKDDKTHISLSAQFKDRLVLKKYMALVFGQMPEDKGSISSEIGRDLKDRKKISSRSSNKKEALTFYEVKKRFAGFCLLELFPKTGRTHQLRVQLSELGHPIVGDELYGGTKRLKSIKDTVLRKRLKELDRFLLHAAYIKFTHPKKDETVEFSAPLTEDFKIILDMLEKGK